MNSIFNECASSACGGTRRCNEFVRKKSSVPEGTLHPLRQRDNGLRVNIASNRSRGEHRRERRVAGRKRENRARMPDTVHVAVSACASLSSRAKALQQWCAQVSAGSGAQNERVRENRGGANSVPREINGAARSTASDHAQIIPTRS